MIKHIIHGLMLLLLIVFGLPVIISLGLGLINNSRVNFKSASHIAIVALRVLVYAMEDTADGLAKLLLKRYKTEKKVLQPIVKSVLIGIFVLALLSVLAAFN